MDRVFALGLDIIDVHFLGSNVAPIIFIFVLLLVSQPTQSIMTSLSAVKDFSTICQKYFGSTISCIFSFREKARQIVR